MELMSTFKSGKRVAKVYSDPVSGYTVEYVMDDRIVKKTHHIGKDLAESVAIDFIEEGGNSMTLLNE